MCANADIGPQVFLLHRLSAGSFACAEMGIRGQLTLLIPAVLAIGLGIVGAIFLSNERRDAVEDFRALNEKVLQTMSVTVAVQVAQNDVGSLDTLIAELSESLAVRDLRELAVLDESGRVLAHTKPELFNTVLTDDFTQQAIASEGPTWAREPNRFRISVPAKSGLRWATVTATYSLNRLDEAFNHTLQRMIVGSLLLFAFIGGVLFWGADRLIVRPLRTLQQTARRMGEGHLTQRVPLMSGREMRELSETMNRMAAALQSERENLERSVTERTKELQEANARLQLLAVTDGLTGLFNHRRFQEALQTELVRAERHKRPLSVLMIDVDFFKKVNDVMGHPAGDELLRKLAEILGADLRQTDMIARYGGEEFTVLLPETTKSEAVMVGERMRTAVEEGANQGNPWKQKVTVSMGVATYPEDGSSGEQVLEAADQAMYIAKRQGRNRVVGARVTA